VDSSGYHAAAELLDGTAVILRAIRPSDRPLLEEGFRHLSPETIRRRFFQAKQRLSEDELRYLTEIDFHDHVALLVTLPADSGGRPIGVGRFIRLGPGGAPERAEVAFTVADEYQGHGVATLLLQHLAAIARDVGIRRFAAEVQPDNRRMLEVFEHSGLALSEVVRDGVTHVELTLDGPPAGAP
jgi:GNAT superfamily N-acetyltransferase